MATPLSSEGRATITRWEPRGFGLEAPAGGLRTGRSSLPQTSVMSSRSKAVLCPFPAMAVSRSLEEEPTPRGPESRGSGGAAEDDGRSSKSWSAQVLRWGHHPVDKPVQYL